MDPSIFAPNFLEPCFPFTTVRLSNMASKPPQHDSEEVPCPDCGQNFSSQVVLASHRAAKHQYLNPLRQFVVGSVCRCCSKQFHSYPRHYHHVRSRPRCAAYAKANVMPLDESEVREVLLASAQVEKARDRKVLKPPCVAVV